MEGPQTRSVMIHEAMPCHAPAVLEIFNYYVLNTTSTFVTHPLSLGSIQDKLDSAKKRHLPFFIAIEQPSAASSTTSPSTITRTSVGDEISLKQAYKVCGYAYALPYRGPSLSYAPTLEITVFVHHACQGGGVGSRLLSAIIAALKTTVHHAFEPGCEDRAVDVRVANAIAVVAFDCHGDSTQRMQSLRVREWYTSRWGFREEARLRRVGFKFGRWIDTFILQLRLDSEEGDEAT